MQTEIVSAESKHPIPYLWIVPLLVVIDQVTKLLIKGVPFLGIHGYPLGYSTEFIGDLVRITYIENPGIAFGLHIPEMKIFFSLFSIVAAVAIYIYLKRKHTLMTPLERFALLLIMSGAIGNLIDRCFYGVLYGEAALFYGKVVDFIDCGIGESRFYIFNIADSCVSVGVTLLAITILFKKKPQTTSAV